MRPFFKRIRSCVKQQRCPSKPRAKTREKSGRIIKKPAQIKPKTQPPPNTVVMQRFLQLDANRQKFCDVLFRKSMKDFQRAKEMERNQEESSRIDFTPRITSTPFDDNSSEVDLEPMNTSLGTRRQQEPLITSTKKIGPTLPTPVMKVNKEVQVEIEALPEPSFAFQDDGFDLFREPELRPKVISNCTDSFILQDGGFDIFKEPTRPRRKVVSDCTKCIVLETLGEPETCDLDMSILEGNSTSKHDIAFGNSTMFWHRVLAGDGDFEGMQEMRGRSQKSCKLSEDLEKKFENYIQTQVSEMIKKGSQNVHTWKGNSRSHRCYPKNRRDETFGESNGFPNEFEFIAFPNDFESIAFPKEFEKKTVDPFSDSVLFPKYQKENARRDFDKRFDEFLKSETIIEKPMKTRTNAELLDETLLSSFCLEQETIAERSSFFNASYDTMQRANTTNWFERNQQSYESVFLSERYRPRSPDFEL